MHGGLDPEGENSVQTSCMIVCKEDVLYNGLGVDDYPKPEPD